MSRRRRSAHLVKFFIAPALAALFAAGCAGVGSTVADASAASADLSATNAPSPQAASSAPTNAPSPQALPAAFAPEPVAKAPRAAPPRRPLQVKLGHGTRVAQVDGVRVYLNRDAVFNRAANAAAPAAVDALKTVSPLATAHAAPLFTGRAPRVFIDPGHGGEDPGAASADGRRKESRIVLEISRLLAARLEKAGFEVRLSRIDNIRTQALEARAQSANAWRADIFVSIHLNSNPSAEAHGAETYILTPAGEYSTMDEAGAAADPARAKADPPAPGNGNDTRNAQLGFAIQRRLIGATKLNDRGLRRARFAVLRGAKMPAALVECGFISSKRNLWFVTSAEGREKIVRGIFEGICDYALGNLGAGRVDYAPGETLFKRAPAPQRNEQPPARLAVPRYAAPASAPGPGEDPAVAAARAAAARAAGLD